MCPRVLSRCHGSLITLTPFPVLLSLRTISEELMQAPDEKELVRLLSFCADDQTTLTSSTVDSYMRLDHVSLQHEIFNLQSTMNDIVLSSAYARLMKRSSRFKSSPDYRDKALMLLSLKFPDVAQKSLIDIFYQEKHFIAPTVKRLAAELKHAQSMQREAPRSHSYRVRLNRVPALEQEWVVIERQYGLSMQPLFYLQIGPTDNASL